LAGLPRLSVCDAEELMSPIGDMGEAGLLNGDKCQVFGKLLPDLAVTGHGRV
jgi:hypothetical protein